MLCTHLVPQGSIKVLYAPTVEDIKLQLKMFAPTLVYLSAGYTASSHSEQVPYATLNSLILQNIAPTGASCACRLCCHTHHRRATCCDRPDSARIDLHVHQRAGCFFECSSVRSQWYDDAEIHLQPRHTLRSNGPGGQGRHPADHVLAAQHHPTRHRRQPLCTHTLCHAPLPIHHPRRGTHDSTTCAPVASPPHQAFAIASHAAQVHLQSQQGGEAHGTHFPPLLPRIYSASPPVLPSPSTVLAPKEGAQGVDVAGWQDVRLLAPSAEVKITVAGNSRLMDVQRVGCVLGESTL